MSQPGLSEATIAEPSLAQTCGQQQSQSQTGEEGDTEGNTESKNVDSPAGVAAVQQPQLLPAQPPVRARRRESLVLLHSQVQASELASAALNTDKTINELEALLASLKTSHVPEQPQPQTPRQPRVVIAESSGDEESDGDEPATAERKHRPHSEVAPRRKSRYMEVRARTCRPMQQGGTKGASYVIVTL